jgi:hypothetical protein
MFESLALPQGFMVFTWLVLLHALCFKIVIYLFACIKCVVLSCSMSMGIPQMGVSQQVRELDLSFHFFAMV